MINARGTTTQRRLGVCALSLAAGLAACGGSDEPAQRHEARPLEPGERLVWRSERVRGNGSVTVSTFVQEVAGVFATPDGPRASVLEFDGSRDWRQSQYVSNSVSVDGGLLHAAQAIAYLADIDDHDLAFDERYTPALVFKQFPLFVGSRWSAQWAAGGGRPAASLEGMVEAQEQIRVEGVDVQTLRIRTTLTNPRLVDWFLDPVAPAREDRVCWWDVGTRRDVRCQMQYAYASAIDVRDLQVGVTLTRAR